VSVVRLMVTQGVSAKAMGTGGFSEFDPVASNETDQGRAMNRRIEVIVLPNLGSVLEDAQAQNQQ
jgi:chemotaxis protein MotB